MLNFLKLSATLSVLIILGCKPLELNIDNEWTLLGHERSAVEGVLEQADYFEKSDHSWAPRASTKMMDNLTLMTNAAGKVTGVARMRLPMDRTGPKLFETALGIRNEQFGKPQLDTAIEEYGQHERRVMWKDEIEGKAVTVHFSIKQHAAVTTGSTLNEE